MHFDTTNAPKQLRELLLVHDIAGICRAYRVKDIKDIAWIQSA